MADSTKKREKVEYPSYAYPIESDLPDSKPELYKALQIDELVKDAFAMKDEHALAWLRMKHNSKDPKKKTKKGNPCQYPISKIREEYFAKYKDYKPKASVTPEKPKKLDIFEEYRQKFITELHKTSAEMDKAFAEFPNPETKE